MYPSVIIVFLLTILHQPCTSFTTELQQRFPTTITRTTNKNNRHYNNKNKNKMVPAISTTTTALQEGISSTTTTSQSTLGGGGGGGLRLGFIGCGTITSAIVDGIVLAQTKKEENKNSSVVVPYVSSISISRRSEKKSKLLQEKYGSLITIYDESQEIVNSSDIIFICVLPQQTCQVLQTLQFDTSKHDLISLASTVKLNELITSSKLFKHQVSRLICLPAIAHHQGVALHCCIEPTTTTTSVNPNVTNLLQGMGQVLQVHQETQFAAALMTCNLMGPIYGQMKVARDWLIHKGGLDPIQASNLIIHQTSAIVQDAVVRSNSTVVASTTSSSSLLEEDDKDKNKDTSSSGTANNGGAAVVLDDLIAEQTPGGINEQALYNLQQLGGLESYDTMLNSIYSRILGNSDGSIPTK